MIYNTQKGFTVKPEYVSTSTPYGLHGIYKVMISLVVWPASTEGMGCTASQYSLCIHVEPIYLLLHQKACLFKAHVIAVQLL